MSIHVLEQILPQYELLAAVHTRIVANVEVPLEMNVQVNPVLEKSTASIAFGRMYGHMSVVRFNASKKFMTNHTHVRVR